MLLLQARESVMRYFRPFLKEHGLTEQQWRVLRALDAHGSMEAGKLAEITSILGPSLSGVLERMERDELITRYRISTDQRKVFVELTKKSATLIESVQATVDQQYMELEKLLDREFLVSLNAMLDRLIALPGLEDADADEVRTPLSPTRRRRACE